MIDRKNRFAPGRGALLLAAVLLAVVGYVLRDYRGVPLGALGSLLWLGALFISFVLGTVYLSRTLLPIPGGTGWSAAFTLLWRHFLSGAPGLPDAEGQKPITVAAKLREAQGLEIASSFDALGAGFLPSHQAASIVRGNTYSRADGPGLIFLKSGETIGGLFDLRPQSRRQPLAVNSRDGIPLKTSIGVNFRVRRPRDAEGTPTVPPDQERLPYPYDRDAIFHLNYTGSVGEGNNLRAWTEQALPMASTLLVSHVARHPLDALLEMGGSEPLNRIKREIETELKRQFEPEGIEIDSVSIGPLEAPPDVARQQLETWQVEWQAKVDQEAASGEAEALRLIQQARAKAQIDIIDNLVQSIELMRQQSDAGLHEIVMMRLVSILEGALGQEAARSALPPELVSALEAADPSHRLPEPDDDDEEEDDE
jgi:regulator of protease activity HflC (stomatin/prohibitin superfamily)